MKALLYIKLQLKFLLTLLLIINVPLVLILIYSPYEIAGIHYFFLIFLVIAKMSYFQNTPYKKNIEEQAKQSLMRSLNRVPSKNQIVVRVNEYANARDTMLMFCAILIFITPTIVSLT